MQSSNDSGFMTNFTMNQNVVQAKYAVRGTISIRAAQISSQLSKGSSQLPFSEIIETNVGNPQLLGQQPITFFRQVLTCIMNPELLNLNFYPEGVKKRAQFYLSNIKGNVGAYSASPGYQFVRESICRFIERRDEVKSGIEHIMLSDGASAAISMVMMALIASSNHGIMIPIPQYPLYSALISLYGGQQVPYHLDEEKCWALDSKKLEDAYREATEKGIKIPAIVIINPGNPTGQVFSDENLKTLVEFAYKKKLCILADEVYQDNIWAENKQFHAVRKIVANMPEPFNKTPVFSFYSGSKGFSGECGIRSGFVEMMNIDPGFEAELQKCRTMSLCSNTIGQILMDLIVNPPTKEESGKEVADLYWKERNQILESMKQRAKMAEKILNSIPGINCQPIEGAMYCFPKIKIPSKAITEAEKNNQAADLLYCLKLLESTGIVAVEGSGFGQEKGTYHFRTTILITPNEKFEVALGKIKKFTEEFFKVYEDSNPKL